MMLPSVLPFFVIPAQAGIHLSARKFLPDSLDRRGALPRWSQAAPWIPAVPGMAVLVGRDAADA